MTKTFTPPCPLVRPDRIAHYTWCAEHEGQRALRAFERCDLPALRHHTRDAAHWAIRVLDLSRPVCPNCGQWVNPGAGKLPTDCMNECHRRGLA